MSKFKKNIIIEGRDYWLYIKGIRAKNVHYIFAFKKVLVLYPVIGMFLIGLRTYGVKKDFIKLVESRLSKKSEELW